jgi:hypothetical protein
VIPVPCLRRAAAREGQSREKSESALERPYGTQKRRDRGQTDRYRHRSGRSSLTRSGEDRHAIFEAERGPREAERSKKLEPAAIDGWSEPWQKRGPADGPPLPHPHDSRRVPGGFPGGPKKEGSPLHKVSDRNRTANGSIAQSVELRTFNPRLSSEARGGSKPAIMLRISGDRLAKVFRAAPSS